MQNGSHAYITNNYPRRACNITKEKSQRIIKFTLCLSIWQKRRLGKIGEETILKSMVSLPYQMVDVSVQYTPHSINTYRTISKMSIGNPSLLTTEHQLFGSRIHPHFKYHQSGMGKLKNCQILSLYASKISKNISAW